MNKVIPVGSRVRTHCHSREGVVLGVELDDGWNYKVALEGGEVLLVNYSYITLVEGPNKEKMWLGELLSYNPSNGMENWTNPSRTIILEKGLLGDIYRWSASFSGLRMVEVLWSGWLETEEEAREVVEEKLRKLRTLINDALMG